MRSLVLILALATVGAAPASRPTTRPGGAAPALIDVKPLEERIDAARAGVDRAKADARARWEASDDYRRAAAQVERSNTALESARAGDDAKAKLDASKAYNDARTFLAKIGMDKLANAGEREIAALREAEAALASAREENRRREDSDPVRQAIRSRKVLRGMTREQVETMFGKPVSTTDEPTRTTAVFRVWGVPGSGARIDTDSVEAVQVDPGRTAFNGPRAGDERRRLEREIIVTFVRDKVVDFQDRSTRKPAPGSDR
jgi:multidrug efflux pump subunit AcrA (membrane-fusion protein)